MTPLLFDDGHIGWIATRDGAAQDVLSDARFSRTPHRRFPLPNEHEALTDLDERGLAALDLASILDQDGTQHTRLRRALAPRFSVKAAAGRSVAMAAIVRTQLEALLAGGFPADLNAGFAQPVSARLHRLLLGIPASHAGAFDELVLQPSSAQEKFDFVRDMLPVKNEDPGEDTLTDLLRSDLDPLEVEGLTFVLMISGRDSVAYMICTAMVALLTHPAQLARLRTDPDLLDSAIEEFMRVGAMFVTLFPRTATQDVVVAGTLVEAGQTVAVSPVAVNRDPHRFGQPHEFDVTRDALGHLGFGFGIHACLGQQVARAAIKEAVAQLLQALPTMRLVHADQTEPQPFAHPVGTYEAGAVVVDLV